MKKIIYLLPITFALLLSACSNKDVTTDSNSGKKEVTNKSEDNMKDNTIEETTTNDAAEVKSDTENTGTEAATAENTDKDEAVVENTDTEDAANAESNKIAFTPSETIPAEYLTKRSDSSGTIQSISYPTYDYFGDNTKAITKNAYVYLPYNYDENKQYNTLYLMHGIGGTEREWGMVDDNSKVKIMMDNLIYNGIIEPFIVVTPNGRASLNFADASSDYGSFYLFGQELRNDLIPYIENTYSTYSEYNKDGYDLTQSRDHRAMAGLSMGGMQTINIGVCESLDLISYFGAFSAAPTSNPSSKIATTLKNYPDYDINYFYNICGTEDSIALASASAAVSDLPSLTDKLTEGDNFIWQQVSGGHGFDVWYLGFYNFAQVAFQ